MINSYCYPEYEFGISVKISLFIKANSIQKIDKLRLTQILLSGKPLDRSKAISTIVSEKKLLYLKGGKNPE